MKGLGTDEKTLIRIFSTRSKEQLRLIAQQFSAIFGRNLEHDVSSETSGNFRKLLIGLSTLTLSLSLSFILSLILSLFLSCVMLLNVCDCVWFSDSGLRPQM
jgi:ABC-type phosphate/phosphonate transport system permease subunit